MGFQSGKPSRATRNFLIVAGAILGLAFELFVHPDPAHPAVGHTLAVAVLMAFYWLTEAMPVAVTALFPVVFFPLAGVLDAGAVAPLYVNNIIFLFIGGFLLAGAMERWNLHRRIALHIVARLGHSPGWLLFGFMAASWAISGWVSNTATTLMMVPIVMALAVKIEERGDTDARGLTVALLLGIAYGASIGGMSTLVGTAPNLALARIYGQTFPAAPEMTFVRWMLVAAPVSAVMAIVVFVWLRLRVMGRRPAPVDPRVMRAELNALGAMSREEKLVSVLFVAFALLIVTRADVTVGSTVLHGWASHLGLATHVSDGTVAMGVALVLFALPARNGEFILDGGAITRLPWDIVLLLGGGFALARAFQVSGLSGYFGRQLAGLGGVSTVVLIGAVCLMITFLTELTSNTATTQVVLPILASTSVAIGVDPLLIMVPATLSASCAFMLPVATPPNAIVFGTGRLDIQTMARTGVVLNIIGVVVVTALMMLFGRRMLGIGG